MQLIVVFACYEDLLHSNVPFKPAQYSVSLINAIKATLVRL